MSNKAVIYARVSTERQMNVGHGLDSQIHTPKDFYRTLFDQVLSMDHKLKIAKPLYISPFE